jgi:cytochrome c
MMIKAPSVLSVAAMVLAALLAGCSSRDDTHDARLKAAGADRSLPALLKVADPRSARPRLAPARAATPSMPAARIWGPNLHGIYGSPMGRNRPAFAYSAALRDANGHWDDATLDAWLRNPQALVPGTYMQFGGISDPLDRADIIAYLRTQKN